MNFQFITSKAIKNVSAPIGNGNTIKPQSQSANENDPHAQDYQRSISPFNSPALATTTQSDFAMQMLMQNLMKRNLMSPWGSATQANANKNDKSKTPNVLSASSGSREDFDSTHGWFGESGDYLSSGNFGIRSHELPKEFQGKIDPDTWETLNKHLYNMFDSPKELANKVLEYQGKAGSLANDPWILSTMIAKGATDKEIKSGMFNFMAKDDQIAYDHQGSNSDALNALVVGHGYNSASVNSTLANKYGIDNTYASSGRSLLGTYQSDDIINNKISNWMDQFHKENGPNAIPKISATFYLINDRYTDHNGVFTSAVRGKDEGQLTQVMVNRGKFSADKANDFVFVIQGSQELLERRVADFAKALHKEGISGYDVKIAGAGHGSGVDISIGGRFGNGDGSLGYDDLGKMRRLGQHLNGASRITVTGISCHSGEGLVQSFANAMSKGVKDMGGNASVYSTGPLGLGWLNESYNAGNGYTTFVGKEGSGTFVSRSVAGNNVDDVIQKDKEAPKTKNPEPVKREITKTDHKKDSTES